MLAPPPSVQASNHRFIRPLRPRTCFSIQYKQEASSSGTSCRDIRCNCVIHMCVYIYIHTRTTDMHCTHTHTHTCMRVYIYIYICTCATPSIMVSDSLSFGCFPVRIGWGRSICPGLLNDRQGRGPFTMLRFLLPSCLSLLGTSTGH